MFYHLLLANLPSEPPEGGALMLTPETKKLELPPVARLEHPQQNWDPGPALGAADHCCAFPTPDCRRAFLSFKHVRTSEQGCTIYARCGILSGWMVLVSVRRRSKYIGHEDYAKLEGRAGDKHLQMNKYFGPSCVIF